MAAPSASHTASPVACCPSGTAGIAGSSAMVVRYDVIRGTCRWEGCLRQRAAPGMAWHGMGRGPHVGLQLGPRLCPHYKQQRDPRLLCTLNTSMDIKERKVLLPLLPNTAAAAAATCRRSLNVPHKRAVDARRIQAQQQATNHGGAPHGQQPKGAGIDGQAGAQRVLWAWEAHGISSSASADG